MYSHGNGVNRKYFSTKKAAEKYIKENKPKDLQYYEDLLLNPENHIKIIFFVHLIQLIMNG